MVDIPQVCICQFSIEVRVSEPKLFSASDAIIIQGWNQMWPARPARFDDIIIPPKCLLFISEIAYKEYAKQTFDKKLLSNFLKALVQFKCEVE